MHVRRPENQKNHWFYKVFRTFFDLGGILALSWSNMASKTNPKTLQDAPKSLQDALKNLQDAFKTPPRRHQDPPSPPKIIDFPWFFQCFSDLFDLLVILVLSGSNMASKTPSRPSKAPPRTSKTPSRTSKTPSRRLQDALKNLQNVIKSLIFLCFSRFF